MEPIIKTSDIPANSIIDCYLAYAKTQPWYCARLVYDRFRGRLGKHNLIDSVLLPEQQYRCSYCMKFIANHNDDATIEHVIRQGIENSTKMSRYFRPEFTGLNSHNVCYTDDYFAGHFIAGQYPHKVAYHNMTIACSKCNSNRGSKEIDPLFFFPNIHLEVNYNRKTGEMTWLTDPESVNPFSIEIPTVEKVKLNEPLLKAIRAIWLYGKDHPSVNYSTPDTITNVYDRKDLIYRTFGELVSSDPNVSMDDLDAYNNLTTEHFWTIALKYNYFGTI